MIPDNNSHLDGNVNSDGKRDKTGSRLWYRTG